MYFHHSIRVEFDPYRPCGSVHYSALIKQTHQCISILSHRLLGVHSSGTLITPVLGSGKPLSHVLQIVLSLHRAHEWLENHHIPARVLRAQIWGGTCAPLLHPPDCFCKGADPGNHVHRQGDSQQQALQTPAIYHMEMKYAFNWC